MVGWSSMALDGSKRASGPAGQQGKA
jgi:hypothetical protein